MKLNGEREGFTLIETLCVLVVTVMVFSGNLFFTAMLKTKEPKAESRFFDTLKMAVSESSTAAQKNKMPLRVTFWQSVSVSVQVVEHGYLKTRRLIVPRSMRLGDNQVVTIAANGFISPQTVRWYDRSQRLSYLQKFQLGWSGFNVEKQKGVHDD